MDASALYDLFFAFFINCTRFRLEQYIEKSKNKSILHSYHGVLYYVVENAMIRTHTITTASCFCYEVYGFEGITRLPPAK